MSQTWGCHEPWQRRGTPGGWGPHEAHRRQARGGQEAGMRWAEGGHGASRRQAEAGKRKASVREASGPGGRHEGGPGMRQA